MFRKNIALLAVLAGFIALVVMPGSARAQWAIGDTLTVIQKPLQNIPSIVLPGDALEISCVASPGQTGWAVSLERGGFQIPLNLVSAGYDSQTLWWTLLVDVPEVPVFELYDLRVTADGGLDDLARQAVKVQASFPDDFYFVHISDTHLPTYLYYYQSGADTDSSTTIGLRHITEDVNIINPAFVLHTGDLVHEGELEEYLGKRYYSRAQRQLREFQMPVFLTAGNHDIGGWDDTPPSDGTARRNWWRFFGWQRLDDPPSAVPYRTQNYSFNYGPVHFTGLESYDNYDRWRYEYYGAESYTSMQVQWLQQDLAATDRDFKVLFHHYDFANELNLYSLGLDMSLSGHIHYDVEDSSAPFDIATDNASGTNRPFRLVRFENWQLSTQPSLEAGFDGETLTVDYSPANDGTNDEVTAVIHNGYGERFEHGLLKIRMPGGSPAFNVIGGTLAQVDNTGDDAVCYVSVDILANRNTTVTVAVDNTSAADEAPAATHLLGAHPNPFNPRTEVAFTLDREAACRLVVFDLHGREVAVLHQGNLAEGRHTYTWSGTDSLGQPMPSGVYFAALRAGDYNETKKLTLVR